MGRGGDWWDVSRGNVETRVIDLVYRVTRVTVPTLCQRCANAVRGSCPWQ